VPIADIASRPFSIKIARAEGEEGAAPFGNLPRQMMQQQMAQEDPSALAPMSPELRRQIAETANAAAGELSPKLQAYIESGLIAPAFKHANEAWAKSGFKIAQPEVAEIVESIAKSKSAVPAARAELDRLDLCVPKTQTRT
jgi:hypothetical protein